MQYILSGIIYRCTSLAKFYIISNFIIEIDIEVENITLGYEYYIIATYVRSTMMFWFNTA